MNRPKHDEYLKPRHKLCLTSWNRSDVLARLALFGLVVSLIQLSGCRGNPSYEQAIANLRAEKIQVVNEYYELKAQYESDMARLGQPIPQVGPLGSNGYGGTLESIVDGGYVIEGQYSGNTVYSSAQMMGTPSQLVNSQRNVAAAGALPGNMSSYIRKVEVDQIPAFAGEAVRLLIRPLDDRGDIIPVEGDIKLRILDSRRQTVYQDEFGKKLIASLIQDRPGQQAGIHLPISAREVTLPEGDLLCDIQFRTGDNRILKQRANLRVGSQSESQSGGVIRSSPANRSATSDILSEDDLKGEIDIELGEELNFDSIDEGGNLQSPNWSPDR